MEQPIYFNNNFGEKLVGTLHMPIKTSGYAVVFGHCFTCTRHTTILSHICSELTEEGFMALRFDFSGNGQSEGDFAESTYSKQISEMQTAIALLSEKGAFWIGLAGHSLGAVIILLTAAQQPAVKAVCTLAGRLSGLGAMHFLSQKQLRELKHTGKVKFSSRGRALQLSDDFFADAAKYNLPEVVSSLQIPLLIGHGDSDEIVPVREAYQAHEMNPANTKLAVIPQADHMFSRLEHRQQISELVVEWFKDQRAKDSL